MSDEKSIRLQDAYDLREPEDSVRLYRKWAETYDATFADSMGYIYPAKVAEVFSRIAEPGDMPVLDAGCGTGLVGVALNDNSTGPIDGLDISPEMLEEAREKGPYRNLVAGNLLQSIDLPDDTYGAIVSAGTFTHGHVGPEGLNELMRVARQNALFIIGVNAEYFNAMDFEGFLGRLQNVGRIKPHRIEAVRIYQGQDHEHAGDEAQMLIFRKG